MSKKIVVKLDVHDNKDKQKALKAVSALIGIDAIYMDMAAQKMTVIGAVDPVNVVSKLRKASWAAAIDSVGPAKEPEKKKDGDKKDGEKKKEAGEGGDKKADGEAAKNDGGDGKDGDSKKDDEGKKAPPPPTEQQLLAEMMMNQYRAYNPYMNNHYFVQSMEENPNSCAIC